MQFIFIDSYSVISSTKLCGNAEGKIVAICSAPPNTVGASECKDICTSLEWCLGYSTSTASCSLVTPTESCANGWHLSCHNLFECPVATQASDLVPSNSHSAFNCFAKGIV